MVQIDRALKELFVVEGTSVIRRLAGADAAEWLNVELPQTRAPRVDILARLADTTLFHLEFQSTCDPDMPWRQLDYYSLLFQRYRAPLRQVVLYVGDPPLRMDGGIRHEHLRFDYSVVDIRSWDGEELLGSGLLGDNILAVLCRLNSASEQVRAIVARVMALEAGRRERALRLLLILSGLRGLTPNIVKEVSRMGVVIDPMKDEYLRGLVEWGREMGKELGKEIGEEQTLLSNVRAVLTHRFGPLPEWAEQRLATAGRPMLNTLLIRAIDAPTLDAALSA